MGEIGVLPFGGKLCEVVLERNRCWGGVVVEEDETLWRDVSVDLEETLFNVKLEHYQTSRMVRYAHICSFVEALHSVKLEG